VKFFRSSWIIAWQGLFNIVRGNNICHNIYYKIRGSINIITLEVE
jgi:hypothetical protein